MRVLTIDTAGFKEIVGIVDGGEIVAATESPAGRGQQRTLLAAVDELLRAAGAAIDDVDGIAVSIGPGRFSGLRVGLATAKGLARGGRPVWGVSTLEALAQTVADDPAAGRWICAATDARRGEVYAALFERAADGSIERVTDDVALPPDEAAGWAIERTGGECVLFAGSGAEAYRDRIESAAGEAAAIAARPSVERMVGALARLTERMATSDSTDVRTLEPVYIRGAVG